MCGTLGSYGKKLLVSVNQQKNTFQFGAVDCLIGWRLFYLSIAQAGRESGVHLRMVVNNRLTSKVRIRAVAWYQQMMPNVQRRAGTV